MPSSGRKDKFAYFKRPSNEHGWASYFQKVALVGLVHRMDRNRY
jgi:hypothetical protein